MLPTHARRQLLAGAARAAANHHAIITRSLLLTLTLTLTVSVQ